MAQEINPMLLDSLERNARVFTANYGVNENNQLVGDIHSTILQGGRVLTAAEKEFAMFALNNAKFIFAAIRKVN